MNAEETLPSTAIGFRHIVLFNFKDDLPQAERDRQIALLRALGELPMVQSIMAEPNSAPMTPDRDSSRVFECCVVADFADQAAFEAFRADPVQHAASRELVPYLDNLIAANIDHPFYAEGLDPARAKAPLGYRHTVLINFKDGLSDITLRHILETMKGAIATQPTVQGFMVGKNILPKSDAAPYAWVCIADFASEEDHTAYQQYPLHQHINADIFTPNSAGFAQFDIRI